MHKMPVKGSKFVYKDIPFELISDLEKKYDDIGGGCRFTAECVIEGDEREDVFEVEWTSVAAYDIVRRKIQARMKLFESLEHVDEEALYNQYGGKNFYGTDDEVCNWEEPVGVYRKDTQVQ